MEENIKEEVLDIKVETSEGTREVTSVGEPLVSRVLFSKLFILS